MTNKKQLTTYIIAGSIGVVAILIALELITMLGQSKTPNSSLTNITMTTNNSATQNIDSSENNSGVLDLGRVKPPAVAGARLEYEITDLMTAFGVEDVDGEFVPEVYTETDVESLSLSNVNQVAPLAGTYKAINLFEQGVEKNLAALEGQGRSISITADGKGNAIVNFLGLDFDATYDDHYLYLEDATKMPYYWDGQTITTAAHRIELDLVRVDTPATPTTTQNETMTDNELTIDYVVSDTGLSE